MIYKAYWNDICIGRGDTPNEAFDDAIEGVFYEYGIHAEDDEIEIVAIKEG